MPRKPIRSKRRNAKVDENYIRELTLRDFQGRLSDDEIPIAQKLGLYKWDAWCKERRRDPQPKLKSSVTAGSNTAIWQDQLKSSVTAGDDKGVTARQDSGESARVTTGRPPKKQPELSKPERQNHEQKPIIQTRNRSRYLKPGDRTEDDYGEYLQ